MTIACLACGGPLEEFLSLGRMPLADAFLRADQFTDEFFYDLVVGRCPACAMVQLLQQPEPAQMFHGDYPYLSSGSTGMRRHFADAARVLHDLVRDWRDPLVVELGSNDGVMLGHIAAAGVRHVGVEPSGSVAELARKSGVQVVEAFFDDDLARDIVAEHGPAAVVYAANTLCHIADIHPVLAGIARLVDADGVFVFEDPYLGDIIANTAFDQIYDEHAFYFSVASVDALLQRHGLHVVDVNALPVHGGSMRYFVAPDAVPASSRVTVQFEREAEAALGDAATFTAFAARVEAIGQGLPRLLAELRSAGKRVVGYGATAKSATVTNYCGLSTDLIEFISDSTPAKQGLFTPGAHIPVRPPEAFTATAPDAAVLFAWNHAEEIMAKERDFAAGGGRWIRYVPEVAIT